MRAPLLLLCVLAGCATPERRPPNVVFVLADDLGWGELGCYGQEHIRTPNLDRLAAEGLRFTQHYAGSPVCAPTRCILLTGKHSGHAEIRGNDEMGARGDVWNDPELEGQRPLTADAYTLGHAFQRAGYATAAVGKWGLGWVGSSGDPNAQGFDRFYGYICQREAHNYYPTHLWSDDAKDELANPRFKGHQKLAPDADPDDPAAYAAYSATDYAPDRMIDEALDFVRANAEQPFLLYFATPVPHLALQVPEDSLAEYDGAFDETPYPGGKGYLPHRTPRAAYAAMITRMDRDVGRILDLLDELELADDTLVVFTSDNGASWVGGVDLDFFRSNADLRGRKAQVWEGGLRVPAIVRWPGRTPPGSVSELASAQWDWFPTLAEIAGAEAPADGDGVSLVPTLDGRALDQAERDVLYWEFRNWQAVRLGDWKGVRRPKQDTLELYDLSTDPGETTDVAAEHPDVIARIAALMESERTPSEHFPLKR